MPLCRPLGAGWHLRPLLEVPQRELLAFGAQAAGDCAADPMNDDARFDRNYLRRQVWPLLQSRWPGAAAALARAARHAGEAQALLEEAGAAEVGRLRDGEALSVPGSAGACASGENQRGALLVERGRRRRAVDRAPGRGIAANARGAGRSPARGSVGRPRPAPLPPESIPHAGASAAPHGAAALGRRSRRAARPGSPCGNAALGGASGGSGCGPPAEDPDGPPAGGRRIPEARVRGPEPRPCSIYVSRRESCPGCATPCPWSSPRMPCLASVICGWMRAGGSRRANRAWASAGRGLPWWCSRPMDCRGPPDLLT